MFKDYSTVADANECLQKCNSDNACKFWDFGEGWCRLRSTSGNGPQSASKYSSGPKNCIIDSTTEPGIDDNQVLTEVLNEYTAIVI